MDQHLKGSWEDLEAWVKDTIGSAFFWCIRPIDTTANREMIANHIIEQMKRHDGHFPDRDTFIAKVGE